MDGIVKTKQRKIGVLTSGGDAPGMNAAIRAVVRAAVAKGIKVIGFRRGYEGILSTDIIELTGRSVSDIIHKGGTTLLTARCEQMLTDEGRDKAAAVCKILGIEALVIIGGDGSLRGGGELAKRGVNVIGIPATIDLDMTCTDYTIGFDTAVNTGMDAINKIRDTSSSHERCSIVEVMGRDAGHIALWCGITGGAEEMIIPENGKINEEDIISLVIANRSKGKPHNLILVAEGRGGNGGSESLAVKIQDVTGIETRATILGHLQRGGSPSAYDRMQASLMGHRAVQLFLENARNRVIVMKEGRIQDIDLQAAIDAKKPYDNSLYEIAKQLSI